jgi:hypothetical protein
VLGLNSGLRRCPPKLSNAEIENFSVSFLTDVREGMGVFAIQIRLFVV